MRFLTDLLIRVVIIVTVTDLLIFYVLARRNKIPTLSFTVLGHEVSTLSFTVLVIIVTLVPLIINILYVFYRFHAWSM